MKAFLWRKINFSRLYMANVIYTGRIGLNLPHNLGYKKRKSKCTVSTFCQNIMLIYNLFKEGIFLILLHGYHFKIIKNKHWKCTSC